MKQKQVLSICGLVIALGLQVACSTAPAATQASEENNPSVLHLPEKIADGRPVTIIVAGQPADSGPVLLTAWQESATRFEKLYPNVTIEGSEYNYWTDSFLELAERNQVPTLFQVWMPDSGKIIEQGIAADLTSIVTAQKLDQIYNPQILSLAKSDGKFYGIPLSGYAMGLAYNIPMLRAAGYNAPPATWDELAAMARKMTDRDQGVAGFSMITDGNAASGWHLTTLAYTFGLKNSDIMTLEGDTYKAGFGSGRMVDALNFLKDLRWKYDVLPRESMDYLKNGEGLALEHAAMTMIAGDQFTWIRKTYPDADMSKFGFAPLPAGPGDQSFTLINGIMAMVSAGATPDQIEAASYYYLWDQLDTNEVKLRFESSQSDPTQGIGAPSLPLFTGAYQEARVAAEKPYTDLPVDNYKLFVDAIASGATKIMTEPYFTSVDYYFYLPMGSVVGKILADPAADPAALAQEAAEAFEAAYPDLLMEE
jgi:multiple sugar transport system substrate-binding protein